MATDRSPLLPGRLGSPNMELQDDPRADPRMIAALVPLGLGASAPLPVDGELAARRDPRVHRHGRDGVRRLVRRARDECGPGRRGHVSRRGDPRHRRQRHHVVRPPSRPTPTVRCRVLSTSTAAAWSFLEAAGAGYARWRDQLAATGLVVVGVEFRNGGGQARSASVSRRSQRLRVGTALGGAEQGASRHLEGRRVGRVGRREPHARDRAQGEARGLQPSRSTACTRSARTSRTRTP